MNCAKRKKQFARFKGLVEDHLPVGEGWSLVTAYGFAQMPNVPEVRRPCGDCERHVFMLGDGSFKRWFDGLQETLGRLIDPGEK